METYVIRVCPVVVKGTHWAPKGREWDQAARSVPSGTLMENEPKPGFLKSALYDI